MKKLLLVLCAAFACTTAFAQEEPAAEEGSDYGFYGGLEITNNNIWRGLNCAESLSFAPTVGYTVAGLDVYLTGSYATEGQYAEFDMGISYEWKGLKLELIDYFYPHTGACACMERFEDEDIAFGKYHNFFNYKKNTTSHQLDLMLEYDPDYLPIHFLWSTVVFGDDFNTLESGELKQAYSSYAEIGYWHEFGQYGRLDVIAGASILRSDYLYGNEKFAVTNLSLQYGKTFEIGDLAEIPVFTRFTMNPFDKKVYLTFGTGISF